MISIDLSNLNLTAINEDILSQDGEGQKMSDKRCQQIDWLVTYVLYIFRDQSYSMH